MVGLVGWVVDGGEGEGGGWMGGWVEEEKEVGGWVGGWRRVGRKETGGVTHIMYILFLYRIEPFKEQLVRHLASWSGRQRARRVGGGGGGGEFECVFEPAVCGLGGGGGAGKGDFGWLGGWVGGWMDLFTFLWIDG